MNTLLLIEDEQSFAEVLKRRLQSKGFDVEIALSTEQGLEKSLALKPTHIVLDMKIGDNNGLHILPQLREQLPKSRIILLTGYASIATAVDAIKSGADDYLSKPVDTSSLLAALNGQKSSPTETESQSMSPARMEWEHIQQVLKQNSGNISATARQLGMHRRTLQRKLLKKPSQ